ncbi:MAG: class I SAM-dependent rRNA methyltransferase [Elusimicrobia bacterium]|nr:class I SAM-dependent rRNA methyltransferase [Elusimicrobiota bacterium]
MTSKSVIIKKDRAQKIRYNRHPWIFSGAVNSVSEGLMAGDIVYVTDDTKNIFAQAAYNPNSDIRLRVIVWSEKEKIDNDWFFAHVKDISERKERLLGIYDLPNNKKNYRVIYSESDNIPGLIIDRYGLVFVLQFQTFFADKNRDLWVSIIKKIWNPSAIYERSDVEVRKKEGLVDLPAGILYGTLPEKYFIEENGFKIFVDIPNGQKTGYFLDLRNARRRVEYWCKILNIKYLQNYFGYTGSFNLYAARAGVEKIEHIDVSESANDIAKENSIINGYGKNIKVITGESFEYLTKTDNGSVDAIILDPPSFVKHREKIRNALEGYERLNNLAIRKLVKNGLLFSFCCSSYISEEDFQKALFKSATIANCKIKVIEKFSADIDHSWSLDFPEGRYLQCWVLQKVSV